MKRKVITTLALLSILVIILIIPLDKKKIDENYICPFCSEKVLATVIAETELSIALYNIRPYLDGHVLVIPKRHVERLELLTDDETVDIHRFLRKIDSAVSKAYQTTGYQILQKNGLEAGQSVPHLHFHYLPRQAGQRMTLLTFLTFFIKSKLGALTSDQIEDHNSRIRAFLYMDKQA